MSPKATATIENNNALDIHEFENDFINIPCSQKILLLPHCLRKSEICKAVSDENGLKCRECSEECQVNILRKAALAAGYRGVCIAPGGSLALKYVQKMRPRGITAVACDKELKEGIDNVKELNSDNKATLPDIEIIPLTKEGCINTEVDIQRALAVITGAETGNCVHCEENMSRSHSAKYEF